MCAKAYFGATIHFILCFVSNRGKQETWYTKPKKVWNLQKAFSLRTINVCRFEIIDGVKYIYCLKHTYEFLLSSKGVYCHLHFKICSTVVNN